MAVYGGVLLILVLAVVAPQISGECLKAMGDNSATLPSFLGFVSENHVKVTIGQLFVYSFGNNLFRQFWEVEIVSK